MKTTDLPARILEAMKYTTKTNGYTVEFLAAQMGVSAKTLRGHMVSMVRKGDLAREYRYAGAVGAFHYHRLRATPARAPRKNRTPASRK